MALTSIVIPYQPAPAPVLPGSEIRHTAREFEHIARSLRSIEEAIKEIQDHLNP